MPRKVFTAGEVLAASDVNSFLMDQTIMTFAGTAARGSAIGSATVGMVSYLEDIDSLSVNNGTAWTTDRTIQVFAGTAARSSAIPSPVEGMYAHLNDTDTLEFYDGSAWVDPSTPSGFTLLAQQTFTSATSITIDNVFSSTYNSYQVVMNTTSSASNNEVSVVYRVGGSDATTNYNTQTMDAAAGAYGGFRSTGVASASIGRTGTLGCILTASIYGVALAQSTFTVSSSYDSALTLRTQGSYHSTATAYDGIKFTLPSSTGEVRIYGLEK
jgi:hypothetical protein